MRKTFIFRMVWADYMEEMSMEERGLFLSAIIEYQKGNELAGVDGIKFVRARVKKELDEDYAKREKTVESRREAGRAGGLVANASKRQQMLANASKPKQDVAKLAGEHIIIDSISNNILDNSNIITNTSIDNIPIVHHQKQLPKKIDKDFDKFWEKYPVKKGKKRAQESFAKEYDSFDMDHVLSQIDKMVERTNKKKKAKEFAPEYKHPATRLNQGCWDDVYEDPPRAKKTQRVEEEYVPPF